MGENILQKGEAKVEKILHSEPWYVWAGGAVAAGTILYFYWRRSAGTTAAAGTPAAAGGTTANDAAALNGFQVDSMAGIPFGETAGGYNYQGGPVDNFPGGGWSETSVNGNNVPIVPSGVNPIYDSNGNLVGFEQPGQQPTSSPSPAPTPAPAETGTIRQRMTSGVTAKYDKPNPGGVPFRSTPGGAVLSTVPYGAQVTITGTPVQGPDNFGSKNDPQHAGSTLWFPIKQGNTSGYISAYDIVNVLTKAGQGSGGVPDDAGGFHLAINQGRNTIDQWTFANGMHQDFHSYAGVGMD
jgi:hypothetical protein